MRIRSCLQMVAVSSSVEPQKKSADLYPVQKSVLNRLLIFFLTSDHSKWSKSGLEDGSEIYRKTKLLLLNHSPGIWVCKLFQFAKLYSINGCNNIYRFFRNPLTIKCSFWIGNFPNWHFRRTVEL